MSRGLKKDMPASVTVGNACRPEDEFEDKFRHFQS